MFLIAITEWETGINKLSLIVSYPVYYAKIIQRSISFGRSNNKKQSFCAIIQISLKTVIFWSVLGLLIIESNLQGFSIGQALPNFNMKICTKYLINFISISRKLNILDINKLETIVNLLAILYNYIRLYTLTIDNCILSSIVVQFKI